MSWKQILAGISLVALLGSANPANARESMFDGSFGRYIEGKITNVDEESFGAVLYSNGATNFNYEVIRVEDDILNDGKLKTYKLIVPQPYNFKEGDRFEGFFYEINSLTFKEMLDEFCTKGAKDLTYIHPLQKGRIYADGVVYGFRNQPLFDN